MRPVQIMLASFGFGMDGRTLVEHYSLKWGKIDPLISTDPLIWNIDDKLMSPLHKKFGLIKKFIGVVVEND